MTTAHLGQQFQPACKHGVHSPYSGEIVLCLQLLLSHTCMGAWVHEHMSARVHGHMGAQAQARALVLHQTYTQTQASHHIPTTPGERPRKTLLQAKLKYIGTCITILLVCSPVPPPYPPRLSRQRAGTFLSCIFMNQHCTEKWHKGNPVEGLTYPGGASSAQAHLSPGSL